MIESPRPRSVATVWCQGVGWRPVVSATRGWRPPQSAPSRSSGLIRLRSSRPSGQTGARRAGAGRRKAKHRPWRKPIRRGIGASSCATKSSPSWNSCVEPSRSCAGNSTKRTSPSECLDSANSTQARHSGSSTKPGRGAGVGCGRRYATASCCSPHLTRHVGREARDRRRVRGASSVTQIRDADGLSSGSRLTGFLRLGSPGFAGTGDHSRVRRVCVVESPANGVKSGC
jgi:hypothetical protein